MNHIEKIDKYIDLIRDYLKEHKELPTSIVFGWEDEMELPLIADWLTSEQARAINDGTHRESMKTFKRLRVSGWGADQTYLE